MTTTMVIMNKSSTMSVPPTRANMEAHVLSQMKATTTVASAQEISVVMIVKFSMEVRKSFHEHLYFFIFYP